MKNSKTRHVNYRFLIDKVNEMKIGTCSILDVGCGKGDIVQMALEYGWDANGIEFFGHGSGLDIKRQLEQRKLLGAQVLEYDGKVFPYPNNSFDFVVSNQVFEHVPDLDEILSEVRRVLKPNGILVCTFPYQDAIREGHSNVLFAHWFPKSNLRFLWLFFFRALGVGRLKKKRTVIEWAKFFNDWLEENTFYLRGSDIKLKFTSKFTDHEHIEQEYISYRLRDIGHNQLAKVASLPAVAPLTRWVGRNFGSLVIIAKKAPK